VYSLLLFRTSIFPEIMHVNTKQNGAQLHVPQHCVEIFVQINKSAQFGIQKRRSHHSSRVAISQY
jgi:hypothetical protein